MHLGVSISIILTISMRLIIPIILCALIYGCDSGLAPTSVITTTPTVTGISGVIYFTPGSWPRADSLAGLMIFASKNYPLDSVSVVAGIFSNPPTIFFYPGISTSLPFFVDSIAYTFPLPAGTYKYIGVIQQTVGDLATQGIRIYRVVGVYNDSLNLLQPGTVTVNNSSLVKNINISVDFHNPPPQPF